MVHVDEDRKIVVGDQEQKQIFNLDCHVYWPVECGTSSLYNTEKEAWMATLRHHAKLVRDAESWLKEQKTLDAEMNAAYLESSPGKKDAKGLEERWRRDGGGEI